MRRASRIAATLAVIASFSTLAVGTAKESEEDRAAREAREQAAMQGMDEYMARMAQVAAAVRAAAEAGPTEQACDAAAMLASAEEKPNNHLQLRTVYSPFLNRFGSTDAAVWTDLGGDFTFLTDSIYRGHFGELPSSRQEYARNDTATRIAETFLRERYLLVVHPVGEHSVPRWTSDEAFDPGYFDGWVFVVDQTDGAITCQWPISVTSSAEVEWTEGSRGVGRLLDETREEALQSDFEDNFEAALERKAPSPSSITTSLGHIL
jgi:hypothetical protein